MAYRFLLEVPDALYQQANVLITNTPDADIVDVHEGIGGNFDAQGKTLTMIGHSLAVVQRLKSWYASTPHDAVPASIVLTNGTRMELDVVPSAEIVAAIRRDQPWVERSIPKIGDHQITTGPRGDASQPVATRDPRNDLDSGVSRDVVILATDEPTDHPVMNIDGETLLHLPVVDLTNPINSYSFVFGATLLGEADRDGRGGLVWRNPDEPRGFKPSDGADYAFMQNGMLNLALERMGRAYPLDVYVKIPAPIRLLVDDPSYENIKARVLTQSWTVLDNRTDGVFGFRDPFGYTWAIHSESFEKGALLDA